MTVNSVANFCNIIPKRYIAKEALPTYRKLLVGVKYCVGGLRNKFALLPLAPVIILQFATLFWVIAFFKHRINDLQFFSPIVNYVRARNIPLSGRSAEETEAIGSSLGVEALIFPRKLFWDSRQLELTEDWQHISSV